jgi:hypothetical protein
MLLGLPCLPTTTFFFSMTLENCEIITKFFFFYIAAEEGEHAFVFFCYQRNKREGPWPALLDSQEREGGKVHFIKVKFSSCFI